MFHEVKERERRPAANWMGLPLLLILLAAGSAINIRGRGIRSGAFLIGDCPYYASASVSLWEDQDLDLKNQLRGGLAIHQKQIALGRSGAWYPKHPILMSIAAAPFYALFGVGGFLLFNQIVWLSVGALLWAICRRHAPPAMSTLAVLLVMEGSFLRDYPYNFSPDLFSAAIVLAGIWLILQEREFTGGLALGISALAKVTNLFLAVLVATLLWLRRPRKRSAWACAGLLPGAGLWMMLNLAMFGGVATTGYDRTLVLAQGVPTVVSHKGFFDVPLAEGIMGQLLDPRVGLLTTSPLLLLALPGFVPLFKRSRWEGLLIVAICEFLFFLFSTYRWWSTSHYGNRFLMVPVALMALPMSLVLEHLAWVWHSRRGESGSPVLASDGR